MNAKRALLYFILFTVFSCSEDSKDLEPDEPADDIFVLPLVVHVLHQGEPIGEGTNLSDERIKRQIEIINEDFKRKTNTPGFNNHPDGGDSKIAFVLAKQDPEGNPTTGIIRVKYGVDEIPDDVPKFEFEQYAYLSYWKSENYINIWVVPYPDNFANVLLGKATGPDSNLPGDDLFQKPLPGGAEGIIINWAHFGESKIEGGHHLGRTLTHELGHYLGLLHTWGNRVCESNDYCEDTPAVDHEVTKEESYLGCNGEEVMIANYMNYTPDHVMNVFTNDQIERIHYVLEKSPRRTSLLTSPGLENSQ
ncbi:MAG: M43 family zinc metalloprotease [Reichenbachiella sp.]|uniref:M43 family zinc metalloprotease n=1 Tax=Reichenbachiella sp. TaxID=2184521 RepID=UPI00329A3FE1